MTGRSRVGKTSTAMRWTERRAPTKRAATPAMTVMGCRRAKTMGLRDEFMGAAILRGRRRAGMAGGGTGPSIALRRPGKRRGGGGEVDGSNNEILLLSGPSCRG